MCLRAREQLKPRLAPLCQLPVHHLQHLEALVCATGSVSVQSECSVILPSSPAPGIPTWALLQARAGGTTTVTNALCSLCNEELCGFSVTCLGCSSQRSGCVYVHVLVSLWPSVYLLKCPWPLCVHTALLPSSHHLPCWCLLDELLDCFGDQAISGAAMHSCVNLSQGATSYIPTPFQYSQGQFPPSGCSRCFNNTAKFRGSPSAECIWVSFGKDHFLTVPEGLSSGFPLWNGLKGGQKKKKVHLVYRQSHGDRSPFNYIKSSRELKKEKKKLWDTLWEGEYGAQPEHLCSRQTTKRAGWLLAGPPEPADFA